MPNHVHEIDVKKTSRLKAAPGEVIVRLRITDLGVVTAEYSGTYKDKSLVRAFAKRYDDMKYSMVTITLSGESV